MDLRKSRNFAMSRGAANQGNKEAIELLDVHCPLAVKALEHVRQAFEIRIV
jgi:hypothetical protein